MGLQEIPARLVSVTPTRSQEKTLLASPRKNAHSPTGRSKENTHMLHLSEALSPPLLDSTLHLQAQLASLSERRWSPPAKVMSSKGLIVS